MRRLITLFSLVLLPSAGRAQLPTVPAEGDARHTAMALVRAIQRSNPIENIYLNSERARGMSQLLSRPMSPIQRTRLQIRIASEQVRAGQTREAIESLTAILARVDAGEIPEAEPLTRLLVDELGIAWLRTGEQENCLRSHTSQSCLLPIRGAGVHQLPEGSRRAIEYFHRKLELSPDDRGTQWLLNIAHQTLGEYPDAVPARWRIPPEAFEGADFPRFTDVAPAVGLDQIGPSGGCAVEDFDGDGLLDVVASSWGLRDPLRLFHNVGDGTFVERTIEAGLVGQIGGLNVEQADVDNDGDVDLLVLRGAWMGEHGRMANSLLLNDGDGTFTDVTLRSGLFTEHPTQAAAFADYDNDGWLDLFIGNESGTHDHPCQLFRNLGDGTFVDVAAEAGVAHVGYVKGVAWGDADNDGLIDLYLSKFGEPNILYRNVGNASGTWRFETTESPPGPHVSFPTWFWDVDNDGWLDLFAGGYDTHDLGDIPASYLGEPFEASHAHVYINHEGRYEDATERLGALDRVILAMGANYGDIDNDGFPDAYIGTGIPDLRSLTASRMLRNEGGTGFVDVTTAGGFGNIQKGHGVAFADVDNDGDQDVFEIMGGAFEGDIYQNLLFENPGMGSRWIRLYVEGVISNRGAIGGRVRVHVKDADGSGRDIYHLIGTGGSFGADPVTPHIGLGKATAIEFVEVRWPATNQVQRWEGLALDRAYRLREGHAFADPVTLKRIQLARGMSHGHMGH